VLRRTDRRAFLSRPASMLDQHDTMPCCHKGCQHRGRWEAVILLRASLRGERTALYIPLPLLACDEHRRYASLQESLREDGRTIFKDVLTGAGLEWPSWSRLRLIWLSRNLRLSSRLRAHAV